jgi:hypothetical protein
MSQSPDLIIFIAGTAWLIPLLFQAFNANQEK